MATYMWVIEKKDKTRNLRGQNWLYLQPVLFSFKRWFYLLLFKPWFFLKWKAVFSERFRLRNNWLGGRCNVRTFEGHTQGVSCVQFDDTRIVSGSSDKTIKVNTPSTLHTEICTLGNPPWSLVSNDFHQHLHTFQPTCSMFWGIFGEGWGLKRKRRKIYSVPPKHQVTFSWFPL